jgi:hypothetical protein
MVKKLMLVTHDQIALYTELVVRWKEYESYSTMSVFVENFLQKCTNTIKKTMFFVDSNFVATKAGICEL